MGIAGACRTDELCKMQLSDVTDNGRFVIVKILHTKNDVPRTFSIVENSEEGVDYLRTFKKYLEIRMKISNNLRFFLRYQSGKCVNQVVGKHTFAKIPAIIAKFLNLPESQLYTGHCFRRSSATLLVNSGADVLGLKRHGGWKSTTVAEGYVAESITNKLDVAKKILYDTNSTSQKLIIHQDPTDQVATSSTPSRRVISFNKEETNVLENEHVIIRDASFSNCTFNFHK